MEEIARLFSIHKNTVRNWFRQGLKPIDGQRPTVVRGEEIRRFLVERRARAKQASGPSRIYCLPCRAPKVPAGNMAECVAVGNTTGTLQGICPDCGRMIYRKVNPQKLDAACGDLDVTITQAGARIAPHWRAAPRTRSVDDNVGLRAARANAHAETSHGIVPCRELAAVGLNRVHRAFSDPLGCHGLLAAVRSGATPGQHRNGMHRNFPIAA